MPACRFIGSWTPSYASMFSRYIGKGLLLEGAPGTLQTAQGGCQIAARGKIEINGNPVRVSWHKSLPLFICPRCNHDCYRIYDVDGWACRRCHRLDYASRHRDHCSILTTGRSSIRN